MSISYPTIYALATAQGRAGIAVIRISGPAAERALMKLAPDLVALPAPRYAQRLSLFETESNFDQSPVQIDDALAVRFNGPNSFTGEDVVELHVHGGHAVISALMTSLSSIEGLRPAEPGEFSRRAFENGKMDLTAVEAIADLVDAETSAQRQQALTQMGGALAKIYDGWRERLVKAMAFAEASIDFSEEDIPEDLSRQSLDALKVLAQEIREHLSDSNIGERIRDGFRIALTGAPNVGKSSLLNALAKRDVAIVSDIAGTTRDVIEVPMDLSGYAAVIIDTAGIRESEDAIEREGVRRALEQAASADLRLYLVDSVEAAEMAEHNPDTIVVMNKCDLLSNNDLGKTLLGVHLLSIKMNDGLESLIAEMSERISNQAAYRSKASAPLTRARHRHALEECVDALDRAFVSVDAGADVEMMAEDVRVAAQALGRITGRVDVEELLDRIFSNFCIGK
ncbi:tRNA uridine-5-carboxymethylaminomethyl(34) synthesis GTPase MnmE [Rhodospirillales bacterium]|nr:tRNA uridine-5-carboxymethylaminomethyl(34) synthesis GTPase MnmE [Rhodospirillales bacterium]